MGIWESAIKSHWKGSVPRLFSFPLGLWVTKHITRQAFYNTKTPREGLSNRSSDLRCCLQCFQSWSHISSINTKHKNDIVRSWMRIERSPSELVHFFIIVDLYNALTKSKGPLQILLIMMRACLAGNKTNEVWVGMCVRPSAVVEVRGSRAPYMSNSNEHNNIGNQNPFDGMMMAFVRKDNAFLINFYCNISPLKRSSLRTCVLSLHAGTRLFTNHLSYKIIP